MFGMEKSKRKKQEFEFDLEHQLIDPAQKKQMLQKIDEKVQIIKAALRTGEDKKRFDAMQTLLHGFLAMHKVITRIKK